jgi:hypothetical protein
VSLSVVVRWGPVVTVVKGTLVVRPSRTNWHTLAPLASTSIVGEARPRLFPTPSWPSRSVHQAEDGRRNHPAHPLGTTVVRPSPTSWWDSTSSIRFSASGCREKRNAEAVRICRIRHQDTPSALLSGLYGSLSRYPKPWAGDAEGLDA